MYYYILIIARDARGSPSASVSVTVSQVTVSVCVCNVSVCGERIQVAREGNYNYGRQDGRREHAREHTFDTCSIGRRTTQIIADIHTLLSILLLRALALVPPNLYIYIYIQTYIYIYAFMS